MLRLLRRPTPLCSNGLRKRKIIFPKSNAPETRAARASGSAVPRMTLLPDRPPPYYRHISVHSRCQATPLQRARWNTRNSPRLANLAAPASLGAIGGSSIVPVAMFLNCRAHQ
jgi:hypothetical protein